jgi:GT2 family glycosyltransferase
VVVDWRRPHETLDALRSLAAMTPAPDILICVENGCSAEGVATVRTGAPDGVTILELPTNVGFAAAVNLGVENALQAGVEWVLLLNNDATVTPRCLGRCLEETTSRPGVAAVGPAITFADQPDMLWFGGGQVNDWLAFTRHRGLMGSAASPPPSGKTSFLTGCCMLVSAPAWKSVGPFRADFFAYYEDVEWCQRARTAGWACLYVGEVMCVHAVSVSSGLRGSLALSETIAYYKARNPMRFALETKQLGRRVTRVLGLMVVWNAYHAWLLLQSRNPRIAGAYVRGIVDAFRGRMGENIEVRQ